MSSPIDSTGGLRGNQRARLRMTPDEVDRYLHSHVGDIVMSTLRLDGTIHSVALYYGFVDGRLGVLSKAKAQKVRNAQRDPRATLLVATGSGYAELRGVQLVGDLEVSSDRDLMLRLAEDIRRRRGLPTDDDTLTATVHNRAALLFTPRRIVSWDHRKLSAS